MEAQDMIRWGQTWHFVARQYIKNKAEVIPQEMASDLGIPSEKAGHLLNSLGCRREIRYYYKGKINVTIYHNPEYMKGD